MKLTELNALPPASARDELARCCAASAWVDAMVASRPFADRAALRAASDRAARALTRRDWLEAFASHPRIGDASALHVKFSTTAVWAGAEQQGTVDAPASVLEALVRGNHAYEARFGYVFIVCATGKRAEEMLALLESRLSNDPARELDIAAAEQMKITHLRLDKLLEES
jgi:2-oxo-4-hydroxy-4-carboxy-5-ureidoimidazoline decarboxylase